MVGGEDDGGGGEGGSSDPSPLPPQPARPELTSSRIFLSTSGFFSSITLICFFRCFLDGRFLPFILVLASFLSS